VGSLTGNLLSKTIARKTLASFVERKNTTRMKIEDAINIFP